MRNLCKANISFLFFALSTLLIASQLEAKITGNCSNCHTMHNSQDGRSVAKDFDGASFIPAPIPKANLLIYSCLGCHSATDGITWKDGTTKAPIVFNTNLPTYNTSGGLAGGNFYWVLSDDTKGHNILSSDRYLTKAPGDTDKSNCGTNSCHANLDRVVSGAGAGLDGRQGCEKCHLAPKHHALVGGLVTSAEQGWYRFLSGHSDGEGLGAAGYEDGDWEEDVSINPNHHNEYLGNQLTGGSGFVLGNTTTAYCTGCHGKFHINQGSQSPWLRHPSDAVLPGSGEYSSYTTYNPVVPVARHSLPSSPSLTVSPGSDMVMCLSCHRAHASPFFKMMRWDYKNWPGCVPDCTNGCAVCHTSKN